MTESTPTRVALFHDFDQRWRAVIEDSAGEEVERLTFPVDVDGVRSAVRHLRRALEDRGLEADELVPVDTARDTWAGPVQPVSDVA